MVQKAAPRRILTHWFSLNIGQYYTISRFDEWYGVLLFFGLTAM